MSHFCFEAKQSETETVSLCFAKLINKFFASLCFFLLQFFRFVSLQFFLTPYLEGSKDNTENRKFWVFFASYNFVSHTKFSVSLYSETRKTNLLFRYFALLIFASVSLRFASKRNEGTAYALVHLSAVWRIRIILIRIRIQDVKKFVTDPDPG